VADCSALADRAPAQRRGDTLCALNNTAAVTLSGVSATAFSKFSRNGGRRRDQFVAAREQRGDALNPAAMVDSRAATPSIISCCSGQAPARVFFNSVQRRGGVPHSGGMRLPGR